VASSPAGGATAFPFAPDAASKKTAKCASLRSFSLRRMPASDWLTVAMDRPQSMASTFMGTPRARPSASPSSTLEKSCLARPSRDGRQTIP
jgi:hypothetical protein